MSRLTGPKVDRLLGVIAGVLILGVGLLLAQGLLSDLVAGTLWQGVEGLTPVETILADVVLSALFVGFGTFLLWDALKSKPVPAAKG